MNFYKDGIEYTSIGEPELNGNVYSVVAEDQSGVEYLLFWDYPYGINPPIDVINFEIQ